MALPTSWPPRPASGRRSIRFYAAGTSSANFSDNAYLFFDGAGANTFVPTPKIGWGDISTVVAVGSIPDRSVGGGKGGSPQGTGGNEPPYPSIWSSSIKITNTGNNDIAFSFDGVNIHGVVKTGEIAVFWNRIEAGIAIQQITGSSTFRIEAW